MCNFLQAPYYNCDMANPMLRHINLEKWLINKTRTPAFNDALTENIAIAVIVTGQGTRPPHQWRIAKLIAFRVTPR